MTEYAKARGMERFPREGGASKDPMLSTERLRTLYAEVERAPLGAVLESLGEYSRVRGARRREKLAGVFGGWGAAPHWWRREPCGGGGACRGCSGEEDPEVADDGRAVSELHDWTAPFGPGKATEWTYTGCGPLYGLKEAAYHFRNPREAKLILKALHEVHPQKLGAGSAELLEPEPLGRLRADLEEV